MAIVRVKEARNSRGGGLSQWASAGNYSRTFIVSSDAAVYSEATIATASHGGVTVPAIGAAHNVDTRSQCNAVNCTPAVTEGGDPSYHHWVAVCQYSVPPFPGFVISPPSRPWRASITGREFQYVPKTDLAGAEIQLNKAGEKWDDPVVEVGRRMEILLEKDVTPAPTLASVKLYAGSVNSAAITILGESFAARELWMATYDVSQKKTDSTGAAYYTSSFRLQYSEETWNRFVANVGWNYLDGGVLKPFFIADQKYSEVPQKLTAAGGDGRGAALNFIEFRIKPEQAWAGLSFPAAWP